MIYSMGDAGATIRRGITMTRKSSYFWIVAAITVLSACGDSDQAAPKVPEALPTGENVMDVGTHEIHVNALSTDQVPAETAQAYGIVRSQKRALLNVAVIDKETNETIESEVTVEAVNLTGQLKNIAMRKLEEQTSIYYIGEVPVANRETLIFDVSVVLPEATTPVSIKFKRQFFSD